MRSNCTEYPKLLIISHNLYDVTNNIGKTLVSLLSGWPNERLAQIYFRNDMPSYNYCEEYFCITDKDIAKSVLSLRTKPAGSARVKQENFAISDAENSLYKLGNRRKPIISLLRDCAWDLAAWKSKNLDQWLDRVAPDMILFVPNDYALAYKVALYVEERTHVPVIPFYMDDSFYYDSYIGPVDNIRRIGIRKLAKEIHHHTNRLLTICDKMSEEYQRRFDIPCKAFVNSVTIAEYPKKKDGEKIIISYLGNLHSNRWKAILDVADALESAHYDPQEVFIRIYSNSLLEDKVMANFDSNPYIEFCGSIPASQVLEKQLESDILLHVEAFDKKSRASTRLSLSTKIPEYMSTGVPILAYGPNDIASIQYLKEKDVAQVCSSEQELKRGIICLLTSLADREAMGYRSFEQAKARHDILNVSKSFQEELINAWEEITKKNSDCCK